MALIPNFSTEQFSGTPNAFTITDTSTGSDVTITSRRIYLLQANGTFLVPAGTNTNYIVWNIADSSIVLDVLSQDTALSCLLYTSPSPRDRTRSRMPSSA